MLDNDIDHRLNFHSGVDYEFWQWTILTIRGNLDRVSKIREHMRDTFKSVLIRVFLLMLFPAVWALAATGLDFPSNGDDPVDGYVVMNFLNPQDHGLPIWGPGGAGATYIWKYRPRQQAGYYVTMWWSNNGSFTWDGGANSYYGGHPYPRGGGGSTTTHDWEIATDRGGDYLSTRAGFGISKQVVKAVWYTQALQVTRNPDGTKTMVFYIDLPSTANKDVIEVTVSSDYGESNPPSPVLLFGDSPWYQEYYGNERLSGILRHIKIFNKRLNQVDILAEAASESLATGEGTANIWYMNINPTPDDITDKSGKGHHFVWANSYRAALWSDGLAGIQNPVDPGSAIHPEGSRFLDLKAKVQRDLKGRVRSGMGYYWWNTWSR